MEATMGVFPIVAVFIQYLIDYLSDPKNSFRLGNVVSRASFCTKFRQDPVQIQKVRKKWLGSGWRYVDHGGTIHGLKKFMQNRDY